MFRFCWEHHIPRWDLFLNETPEFVWDGWTRWMLRNPDHPAHRDQLQCDMAALIASASGAEVTKDHLKFLMANRLRRPYQPGQESDDDE